jgi:hypothetical protein
MKSGTNGKLPVLGSVKELPRIATPRLVVPNAKCSEGRQAPRVRQCGRKRLVWSPISRRNKKTKDPPLRKPNPQGWATPESRLRHATNWSRARCVQAAGSGDPSSYMIGREPVMRISTRRLALCGQSGLDATLATPTSARRRSIESRSFRMSPLLIARFTRARSASWV